MDAQISFDSIEILEFEASVQNRGDFFIVTSIESVTKKTFNVLGCFNGKVNF